MFHFTILQFSVLVPESILIQCGIIHIRMNIRVWLFLSSLAPCIHEWYRQLYLVRILQNHMTGLMGDVLCNPFQILCGDSRSWFILHVNRKPKFQVKITQSSKSQQLCGQSRSNWDPGCSEKSHDWRSVAVIIRF